MYPKNIAVCDIISGRYDKIITRGVHTAARADVKGDG
jgi:hypothetical protein